jgi:hypothetical protein
MLQCKTLHKFSNFFRWDSRVGSGGGRLCTMRFAWLDQKHWRTKSPGANIPSNITPIAIEALDSLPAARKLAGKAKWFGRRGQKFDLTLSLRLLLAGFSGWQRIACRGGSRIHDPDDGKNWQGICDRAGPIAAAARWSNGGGSWTLRRLIAMTGKARL